jgi:uncharacterized protein DUF4150/HNH/endonuclease VII toxin of polymorphic toxin system
MANQVYANGREIACKAGDGKTIAAFPDVCLSPPSPPAGPVPIPYPNTAFASDTTNGSKTVQISGQEVMLKDSSTFKKSTGDEAATKSLGMGVVTHQIQGEASFVSWSMDVKFEGANVDRHLDMTVHNEQSMPAQTPPFSFAQRMAMMDKASDCETERKNVDEKCDPWDEKAKCPDDTGVHEAEAASVKAKEDFGDNSGAHKAAKANVKLAYQAYAKEFQSNPCQTALKCALTQYSPSRCCSKQTPDHVIEAASFGPRDSETKIAGWSSYKVETAPCICAEGPNQTTATHGVLSVRRGVVAQRAPGGKWPIEKAAATGAKSVHKTYPGCSEACIKEQILKQHEQYKDAGPEQPILAKPSMTKDESARTQARIDMGVPG